MKIFQKKFKIYILTKYSLYIILMLTKFCTRQNVGPNICEMQPWKPCVIETSYNVWRHCHNHKNSNCWRNINRLPLFLVWIQKKWNSCMSLVYISNVHTIYNICELKKNWFDTFTIIVLNVLIYFYISMQCFFTIKTNVELLKWHYFGDTFLCIFTSSNLIGKLIWRCHKNNIRHDD
jgi:hypothetical protein